MTAPPLPQPDNKDWTWAATQPCPECGFDPSAVGRNEVPNLVRTYSAAVVSALERRSATIRPQPTVWSPLEYGCHVRDVCRIFTERLDLMLGQHDPRFANWDQDETAVEARYWAQDPVEVCRQLHDNAARLAEAFERVGGEQWSRPSRRSNGSVFTVDSFARYLLHDLAHHAWDVTP